jgi:hypothetical protein
MTNISQTPTAEFLESMLLGEAHDPQAFAQKEALAPVLDYVAHGAGVVAVASGRYEEASRPPVAILRSDALPSRRTTLAQRDHSEYQSYGKNTPAAIQMRGSWARRLALFEQANPHIVLGQE